MKKTTLLRQIGQVCFVLIALIGLAACNRSPEARSAKFMAEGKKFLAAKDPNRAVIQFRNAAQATPNNPEVFYQMGVAYLDAGDIRQGVLALRKTVEMDPKHQAAQLRLSQIMASVDDPEILKDAQDRLKTVLQGNPASVDAMHALALTELKLGDAKDGVQLLQQALASAPQDLRVVITLAQAKLQQGDAKAAEDALKKFVDSNSKNADAHTTLADFYISQNRMNEAESELRGALSLDSRNVNALVALARLQLALNRKQEAEQTFKQAAAFPSARLVYGTFLFQEGRHSEAITEFERLYKADPADRQARTNLVVAYYTASRSGDAQKVLAEALKRNNKDSDALLQRGELYLETRAYSLSEADLNQVLKMRPDAPEIHYVLAKLQKAQGKNLSYRQELAEALRLNPYLVTIRAEAARELVASGNAQAAIDLVNAAPTEQKNSVAMITERNWAYWGMGKLSEMRSGIEAGLKQQKTPELLLQDGLWKLGAGQSSAARTALEAALNGNPSDVRALAALRQTYSSNQASPEAAQKVKEYAAKNPKSAPVQEFLGMVLVATGDRAGARKAFEAAKALEPNSVKPDMRLAQLDVLDQKFDNARNRLAAVVKAGNSDPTTNLWLANLEEAKGNHDAALKLYQQVVAADPSNGEALNNLAYSLAEYAKKPDEALRHAQRAVELQPTNPSYTDTLGWILYQKGLYSNSLRYLELAAASKENVVWKYHLAMAYAKAGQAAKGREVLQTALKINPRAAEAQLAQQVVEKSK